MSLKGRLRGYNSTKSISIINVKIHYNAIPFGGVLAAHVLFVLCGILKLLVSVHRTQRQSCGRVWLQFVILVVGGSNFREGGTFLTA